VRPPPNAAQDAADSVLLHRLLFFSDAVFAIVLTLLVLDLRVPEVAQQSDMTAALAAMSPNLTAFAASFALVSVFWMAHLSITRRLIAFDWLIAWLNMAFLFAIALMPFASGLLGRYGLMGPVWRIYCLVLIAASAAQTALLLAIVRDRGRLVGGMAPREFAFRLLRALSPALAFGTGLTLSYAGRPYLAAFCWLLFPPILIVARLLAPRRSAVAQ
jgi:uncharacterized membrane protein